MIDFQLGRDAQLCPASLWATSSSCSYCLLCSVGTNFIMLWSSSNLISIISFNTFSFLRITPRGTCELVYQCYLVHMCIVIFLPHGTLQTFPSSTCGLYGLEHMMNVHAELECVQPENSILNLDPYHQLKAKTCWYQFQPHRWLMCCMTMNWSQSYLKWHIIYLIKRLRQMVYTHIPWFDSLIKIITD